MEFQAFEKIGSLKKIDMAVTQKIHGTNAAVYIYEYTSTNGISHEPRIGIRCQSRSRFIFPGDDNYGFASFVEINKQEFIRLLGPGLHFGEWAGPGINSGEGLTQKTFVLFDWWKFPPERQLPPQTTVVPLLYSGPFNLEVLEGLATNLKSYGSKLVPGFMRPEGMVIQVLGQRIKQVFAPEETQWTQPSKTKSEKVDGPDVSHLFQPVRMEKLLSRDEKYLKEYPKSLKQICSDYMADLIAEGQITGDEDQIKATRKAMGSQLFGFAKEMVEKQVTLSNTK